MAFQIRLKYMTCARASTRARARARSQRWRSSYLLWHQNNDIVIMQPTGTVNMVLFLFRFVLLYRAFLFNKTKICRGTKNANITHDVLKINVVMVMMMVMVVV